MKKLRGFKEILLRYRVNLVSGVRFIGVAIIISAERSRLALSRAAMRAHGTTPRPPWAAKGFGSVAMS